MEEAAVPFVDATALEKFVNEALVRRPRRPQDRVDLKTEALFLSHSDVTLKNFLWDPVAERVWMVDYQHVNILPQSFASFYLHRSSDPFVKAVAAKIDFPVSSKLDLLMQAAYIVLQSGNSSFGLDEYGNIMPRRRRARVA